MEFANFMLFILKCLRSHPRDPCVVKASTNRVLQGSGEFRRPDNPFLHLLRGGGLRLPAQPGHHLQGPQAREPAPRRHRLR